MSTTSLNSPRLTRLIVVAWLTLLSIAVVMLALSVNRLDAQRLQDAPDAQIAELQSRTLELETFRTSVEVAPSAATESDLQQIRDDSLHLRLQDFSSTTELASVQSRLDTLAQQINTTKSAANKPLPRTAKLQPAAAAPTFQVLGVELRGGVRFLAIQPQGTTGLASVHLFRVGETEGCWQLEALDSRTAQFRIDHQTRHLLLPKE